jgi:hypothetical protein
VSFLRFLRFLRIREGAETGMQMPINRQPANARSLMHDSDKSEGSEQSATTWACGRGASVLARWPSCSLRGLNPSPSQEHQ